MSIIITPLRKAIDSLADAMQAYNTTPNEYVRDACIKRFEYTYGLSHKMIQRYLLQTEPNKDEIKAMSFADLIRTAYERNLIVGEWAQWSDYRDMCNKTSHTYDSAVADTVFNGIADFLYEAQQLLYELERRNAQQ